MEVFMMAMIVALTISNVLLWLLCLGMHHLIMAIKMICAGEDEPQESEN